jgi:hypothetical protein
VNSDERSRAGLSFIILGVMLLLIWGWVWALIGVTPEVGTMFGLTSGLLIAVGIGMMVIE